MTYHLMITDYHIQALVDNELDWEDEKRVWSYVQNHPYAHERYEELHMQKRLLQNWWQHHSVGSHIPLH